MPEGPEEGDALPVVPARSPRRLSLGDGGAGRVPWRGWGGRGGAEAGVWWWCYRRDYRVAALPAQPSVRAIAVRGRACGVSGDE